MFHAKRKQPPRPNRDHLVDQADKLHRIMLRADPTAQLEHGKRKLAQEYGFRGWNRLLRWVDSILRARAFILRSTEQDDVGDLRTNQRRGWVGGFYFAGDAPPSMLRRLLEYGLDPNADNWQRDTLLHFVIRHQRPETLGVTVTMLLDAGADASMVNWDDDTPLDELRRRRGALGERENPAYQELEDRLSSYLPMDGDDNWMCDCDAAP